MPHLSSCVADETTRMVPGGSFQPLVMFRNLSTRSVMLLFSIRMMKRHCFSVFEGSSAGKA